MARPALRVREQSGSEGASGGRLVGVRLPPDRSGARVSLTRKTLPSSSNKLSVALGGSSFRLLECLRKELNTSDVRVEFSQVVGETVNSLKAFMYHHQAAFAK